MKKTTLKEWDSMPNDERRELVMMPGHQFTKHAEAAIKARVEARKERQETERKATTTLRALQSGTKVITHDNEAVWIVTDRFTSGEGREVCCDTTGRLVSIDSYLEVVRLSPKTAKFKTCTRGLE